MTSPYAHGHQPSVVRGHSWRTVANSAQYVVPYVSADSQILDVGCGPGSLTNDLGSLCPQGSVIGIDTSKDVIEGAKTSEHRENVTYQILDAFHLPFDDDSFDVVHAHQVLQHVADPVSLLIELARVVRPSGVIAVRDSEHSGYRWSPESAVLDKWLATYIAVARFCGGEPDAGRFLESWASQAGLETVNRSTSKWLFETPEDVKWWGNIWADRVLGSNFADHARNLKLLTDSELQSMHDGWVSWSNSDPAYFMIPHDELIARKTGR